ncbi:two-component sensor histidine kinase [Dactylosporangium sucinum]|uniref:histidine kinase n=1 Tax=Dactylosporangium sucinum TaxID=1424081 RepID=A0A917X772_9ACTN|nr:two-component sensor histidine kinase [Dactylosporangium sucinum]
MFHPNRNRLAPVQQWLLDLLFVGLIALVVVQIEWPTGPARAVAVGVVSVACVLTRRRWPIPALLVGTAATLAEVIARAPATTLTLTLGVLMYAATRYTDRTRPWVLALGVAGVLFVAGMLVDAAQWWQLGTFALFAWIGGGAAVGDAARNRRAYIAEVTERARQAEQTREDEARRRVMDERLRIARELHDVVAHHIAVINVQAGAAGHVLRKNPDLVWPVLEHIRQASDTVLREIRSVIGVLREPGEADSTEPSSGLDRVPDLLANLTATGFTVAARTDGDARPLPAIVDLAAYRIVQEALTNAHRYGDGDAELTIAWTAEAVTVEVTNRIGLSRPAGPGGSGFGLIGMRERAAAAHGTVTTGRAPDGRFRVCATLPLHEPGTAHRYDTTGTGGEGDQQP